MTMILSNGAISPVHRDIIRSAKDGDVLFLSNLLNNEIPAKVLINALCYSVRNSHLPCCKLLLDNGANVDGVGLYGSTPLLTAVGRLNLEIARMLLQRGADVNARDEIGRTPLLVAILNIGDTGLLRLLLEAGADANMADSRGLPPLWAAMLENGNPDVLRLLLECGADATVQYFGKNLLEIARKNGLKEFEQILEEYPCHCMTQLYQMTL